MSNAKVPALRSGWGSSLIRAEIAKRESSRAERKTTGPIGLLKGGRNATEQSRPSYCRNRSQHDSGSAANETVDGLDATTEALRHAA